MERDFSTNGLNNGSTLNKPSHKLIDLIEATCKLDQILIWFYDMYISMLNIIT